MNTVTGRVVADGGAAMVDVEGHRIPLAPGHAAAVTAAGATEIVLGVRPEHLTVGADGVLPAVVTVIESLGHERHVICRLDGEGQMVILRQGSDRPAPAIGSAVHLAVDPSDVHVFDARTEQRLESSVASP